MFPDVMAAARGDTDAPADSRWVGPEGRRTRYLEAGSGPPVLLIHGATSTADDPAAALFDTLAERHRVVSVDRPGHGWSDRVRWTHSSVQAQAAVVGDAVAALGLERPVVVGHSYGGAVAMALALKRPDAISGVVALAPVIVPEPRLEHLLFSPRAVPGAGDAFTETAGRGFDRLLLPLLWEAQFTPQKQPERFRAAFPYERAKGSAQVVATGEDATSLFWSLTELVAGLHRCAVPVRVLVGEADKVVNPNHSRFLARTAPCASIELLPELGHMIHWFAQSKVADTVEALSA